jgi:Sulfotransferase domain
LPIFRLNRVFPVARGVKAFLNLKAGLTRGAVPDVERHEKQAKKLRNAQQLVREQRKTLRSKDQELKEQDRNLKRERQRNYKRNRELRQQRLEIFQLNNELAATRRWVKNAENGPLSPHASGAPEVGRLPDFVVIGAQKCGTGFFYRLLTQHPHVEPAAAKELHFFDRQEHFSKGIEWYRRFFPTPMPEDGQKSITGEGSPSYLINRHAPERLAGAVPEARLIVLLRNPVDRAYSHYHHVMRNGKETRSFEEAIEEGRARLLEEDNEPSRPGLAESPDPGNSHPLVLQYLRRGIYVDQLLRWREFFPREQMLVLKSEDFFKRPQESLKLVQSFLEVPYWEPELPPRRTKPRYEPMDPATRRLLEEFFEPHNRRLYDYLGVDFGW